MKKGNKTLFYGVLVGLLGICLFLYFENIFVNRKNPEKTQDSFTEKELMDMAYVDDAINALLKEENYQKMGTEEKVKTIEKLLEKLKKEKYIKYYIYDDEQFSFEYSCNVLGGIRLKEFDPMLN